MKTFRSLSTAVVVLIAGLLFAAGVPTLEVTVSDASGKLAYKGRTTANGTFSTSQLAPGNYVVQFTSRGGAGKGARYNIVASAGKKKVVAEAVGGEKFSARGVAMRIEVGKGLNITGQVSTGGTATAQNTSGNAKVKVVNGKRYIWVVSETGSNMGGHWVEEGSPAARNVIGTTTEVVGRVQDNGVMNRVPGAGGQ